MGIWLRFAVMQGRINGTKKAISVKQYVGGRTPTLALRHNAGGQALRGGGGGEQIAP
jgi:hypothetical protein